MARVCDSGRMMLLTIHRNTAEVPMMSMKFLRVNGPEKITSVRCVRNSFGLNESANTHMSGATHTMASAMTAASTRRSARLVPTMVMSERLLAAGHPHLERHGDQHDAQQHLRGSGGIAQCPMREAGFVDELHDGPRTIVRAALGQQLRLPEYLELENDLDHGHQHHRAANGRQGDVHQRAPAARVVERGGFIELAPPPFPRGQTPHHRPNA